MRKITFLMALLLGVMSWQTNAQTLNQPANWPNANWTLNVIEHTGTNAQDIEADPTNAPNFAYDDDDTGGSSHDIIAAESPVIDLTAAQAAGENYITVQGEYVYNNYDDDEYLAIEYWDADAATWNLMYQFPNNDTSGAPTDNYCDGTPQSYVSDPLNISSFTANQLSGFKYRFIYNDDITGGNGYNWGFCFSSPTIQSAGVQVPIFTLTANPDCANNQFSVDVNVTDLGGSSSVTISDDQGSATQQLTAAGTLTFGPYASGTTVNFTVTSDDDTSINASDAISYTCPPVNDVCSGAETLTLDPGTTCTNSISVSNAGTTDSGVAAPSCGSYQASNGNGDLWYAVTIPTDVTEITLNVSNVTGLTSVAGAFYSGDCTNLTEVSCTEFGIGWPWTISGLTSGETYYLRVWDYGNNQLGTFDLCGYYTSVSIADNQIAGFKFYPNPVNNILNLSAKDNINQVVISNIMGQEVLKAQPEATQTQINMSHLTNGVYFVKVDINGQVTAFKVIKK